MAKSENESVELLAFVIKCKGKAVHIRAQDIRLGGDFLFPQPLINCPECGEKHFVELKGDSK